MFNTYKLSSDIFWAAQDLTQKPSKTSIDGSSFAPLFCSETKFQAGGDLRVDLSSVQVGVVGEYAKTRESPQCSSTFRHSQEKVIFVSFCSMIFFLNC